MTSASLNHSLDAAIHTLLSLKSTSRQRASALTQLETTVATLALDPSRPTLDRFSSSQDTLDRNLTAVLLEWLGRTLARHQVGQPTDAADSWENVARVLRLLQGLLLLHRSSQRLFSRPSSLEYLLAVLDMTRPSQPFSPSLSSPKPFPSPVIFPASPSLSASSPMQSGPTATHQAEAAAANQLALAALDTLLCALVDRPKNMRVFEELGGLDQIVKVLKDKGAAQVVRIKVIELLYFYLLPEQSRTTADPSLSASVSSAATSSTLNSQMLASDLPNLLASAADFVPQTPHRPRTHAPSQTRSSKESTTSSSRSASSRDSSPTRTPRRSGHARSQSLINSSALSSSSSNHSSASVSRPLSTSHAPTTSLSCDFPTSARHTSRRHTSISESSSERGGNPLMAADFARTPRASRLPDGLLSSAAADLPSSTPRPRPPPHPHNGHRRTQSSSSVERDRLTRSEGLPPLRETRRPARARPSKGSNEAEEMPPPRLPPTSSSSSRARPSSHSRSRSLATTGLPPPLPPPSPRSPAAASSAMTAPSSSQPRSSSSASRARTGHVRTEQEKKDLLRKVMPNVDALEERFKAMGLGLS
ncbi:hypothetical protein JCM11641_005102 [Rhodosporidiobolus odoratus]